ncbi:MAG: hypothetical protein P8Z49_00300 [Acidobacteriota bacterium]|jgi:Tfp pilus assembly protein PilP
MSGLKAIVWVMAASGALIGLSALAQSSPTGTQAGAGPEAQASQGSQPGNPESPEESMLTGGESLYHHQGGRDPFSPLIRGAGKGGSDVKVNRGSTGLSRFTVEACLFEGVVKTPKGTVALFQGPDLKPYQARVGEKFADGVVVDVSYSKGEVVIQQELNDPTAIKPFRNLVLKLRSQEGEGQ